MPNGGIKLPSTVLTLPKVTVPKWYVPIVRPGATGRTLDDIVTEAAKIAGEVAAVLGEYEIFKAAIARLKKQHENLTTPHRAPVGLVSPGEVPSDDEVLSATQQTVTDMMSLRQIGLDLGNNALLLANRKKLNDALKQLQDLATAARKLPRSRDVVASLERQNSDLIESMRRLLYDLTARQADIRDGLAFAERALEKLTFGGRGMSQEDALAGAVGMVGLGGGAKIPGIPGEQSGLAWVRGLLGKIFRKSAAKVPGVVTQAVKQVVVAAKQVMPFGWRAATRAEKEIAGLWSQAEIAAVKAHPDPDFLVVKFGKARGETLAQAWLGLMPSRVPIPVPGLSIAEELAASRALLGRYGVPIEAGVGNELVNTMAGVLKEAERQGVADKWVAALKASLRKGGVSSGGRFGMGKAIEDAIEAVGEGRLLGSVAAPKIVDVTPLEMNSIRNYKALARRYWNQPISVGDTVTFRTAAGDEVTMQIRNEVRGQHRLQFEFVELPAAEAAAPKVAGVAPEFVPGVDYVRYELILRGLGKNWSDGAWRTLVQQAYDKGARTVDEVIASIAREYGGGVAGVKRLPGLETIGISK